MEKSEKVAKNGDLVEEAQEERKRYISRLQRRAQSQIASDLGGVQGSSSNDEQISTLIRQIVQETGARRVTLYRPIPRGQRWHAATALDDGGHHFGLVAPESAVLPMIAFSQRRSIVWSPTVDHQIPSPRPDEFGYNSYIGVPLLKGDDVVAVVEAVDFEKAENLGQHVGTIEQRLSLLGHFDKRESVDKPQVSLTSEPVATLGLTESSVLDLVLRLQLASEAVIEITPDEWRLLNHLNGERSLGESASNAGFPVTQAIAIAAGLLGRGLIKEGREQRRRG